jgi:hypothetical protein
MNKFTVLVETFDTPEELAEFIEKKQLQTIIAAYYGEYQLSSYIRCFKHILIYKHDTDS